MSQMRALVDKLLTDASSAYTPSNFICEQILPFLGVVQSTGKLGKYGTDFLRIENSRVGGRGKYRTVEAITRSTTSYEIESHGLEGLVTREDYRNVEQPFDAERDETMGLSTLLYVEKELMLAQTLSNTSVMTNNETLSGTAQLSDYTNSDPVGVISDAHDAVYDTCGNRANVAIMNVAVRNKLRYHPKLLDTLGFKYNRPGGLKDEELALALSVDKILVGEAMYESAKEGQASSLAPIWGKHLILAVCPDKAELMQSALGYRLGFKNKQPRQVRKWAVNNPPESTAILVEDEYQFLISNAGAGCLIQNAIA